MESIDNIIHALSFIPADDRSVCINVGMALNDELGISGYEIWDSWLQTGEGYNKGEMKTSWKGFTPGRGITIATVFKLAKDKGYKNGKSTISPEEKIQREKDRKNRMVKADIEKSEANKKAKRSMDKILAETQETGDPAILYCKNRGIGIEVLPEAVRFHPSLGYYEKGKLLGKYPAIISKVTNLKGEVTTIHKIYLTEKGEKAPVNDPKKKHTTITGIDKTGASIKLAMPIHTLGVAEGLETSLAGFLSGQIPFWSCLDSVGLKKLAVPDSVTTVYILADKDINNVGQEAANELAQRLIKEGKTVHILLPEMSIPEGEKGVDWLDALNSGVNIKACIGKSIAEEKREYGIPEGYECTAYGVKQLKKDEDGKVRKSTITLKKIKVTALSRSEKHDNWGMLVSWLDLDDQQHEIAIPRRYLHSSPTELAQMLADGGLPIIPGKERDLLRYLASFNVKNKLIAASCTGWQGEAFVLPYKSINEPPGQRIVYQPSGFSNTAKAIREFGDLESWKLGMVDASPMLIFFVCASLSASVRYKVGIEAGGFHVYHLTSHGKTTMLQAAASVWGNGVDPAIAGGDEAYIQRWNSTSNALEAKAELFNDISLIVDEIGEGDPKEFGQTIYRVISGSGRGRSGRSGELRDSKSWRVTILSAGEIGVSDFIESGGSHVKGGQIVRMIDIDLSAMPPLFKDGNEANAMKKHCATHYGHAGTALLERVPDLSMGFKYFDKSKIGNAFTSIASRVRDRFSLVAHTGYMGVNADILPWSEEQILNSVKMAYEAWHDKIDTVSDIDRGVIAVHDFILKHASRFEIPNADFIPSNRAGWHRDNIYHFTQEAFKEACGGCDATKVKRALNDAGLLHTNKEKGLSSRLWQEGKVITVVSVKADIFSMLSKNGGNGGNGGNEPCIPTD